MCYELENNAPHQQRSGILRKVDLAFFFSNIADEFYVPLSAKGIEMKLNIEQENNLYIDSTLFRIAVFNIIDNAIRFHDEQKSKKWIHIHANVTFKSCAVAISDNGLGIEKSNLKNVFKIFFSSNRDTKSVGLGLYIVKEVLEKMGGSVTVESKYKQGTKFIIWVPNGDSQLIQSHL
jgi:signal transduction histidine kinase